MNILPVGRPLASGGWIRLFKLLQPLLQGMDLLLKEGDLLLLPEDLFIQLGKGMVLQCGQAFKLVDSMLHSAQVNRFSLNGEWIHPLLR